MFPFASIWLLATIFCLPFTLITLVEGHGYIYEPPARNYIANLQGLTFGSKPGVPNREYCPQCLNQNGGVCGITQDGTTDYDLWLDSTGMPIPFQSQRTYRSGQIIEVGAVLTANHGGHAELRGCPIDENQEATQACLDEHTFEFISDETYDLPADDIHPERGYFYGGAGANGLFFTMKFRIPSNLVGSKVLLQWQYITSNSCSPPGYADYFGGGNSRKEVLPDAFWSPLVDDCQFPYPEGATPSASVPERFWNCAEVTILDDGVVNPNPTEKPSIPPNQPTTTTPPTNSPTDPPASSVAPVFPSTPNPTTSVTSVKLEQPFESPEENCRVEWESCFDDVNSCCDEHYCEVFQWYAHCRRRSDACLLEWNACNDDESLCCEGLVCKGDGWKMCQVQ